MPNVLFLLAHNDDEYFASLRIREELHLGNRVFIAYLTYGGRPDEDPGVRVKESLGVLGKSGIREADLLMIGRRKDIRDLRLHEKTVDAYQDLAGLLGDIPIERIYVMAWEGGHPDHDASHLIGMAFACRRNLREQVYEFPAYSRFRVMHPPCDASELLIAGTSRMDAFRTLVSGFSYRSQRRTFLAMLPGSIVQLLLLGYQNYWLVPHDRDYAKPPHAGRLFYERRYHISFATFSKNVACIYQYLRG
ncbi:MAG: PIG-L family deacetylase [Gammaproteobacteria bacterium]